MLRRLYLAMLNKRLAYHRRRIEQEPVLLTALTRPDIQRHVLAAWRIERKIDELA